MRMRLASCSMTPRAPDPSVKGMSCGEWQATPYVER